MTRRQPQFIVITGGSRSGKSQFAVALAKRLGRRVTYLATCGAADAEMRARIRRHRAARPAQWRTIEHPSDPAAALARLNGSTDAVILDCLTMYIAELLMQRLSDETIAQRVTRLCAAIRRVRAPVILVTNEVGSSVVPDRRLGRRFRDVAGVANQQVVRAADQAFFMVAGMAVPIKGAARGGNSYAP